MDGGVPDLLGVSSPRPMRYSVVIPAYQAGATIEAAVGSALAQELAPVEVLVVDDGSTDDTAGRAEAAGARVIRQSANQGAAVARNIGLAAANAPRVALLDADDTWTPGHLSAIAAAFTAVPQAKVAFGGSSSTSPRGVRDPDSLPDPHPPAPARYPVAPQPGATLRGGGGPSGGPGRRRIRPHVSHHLRLRPLAPAGAPRGLRPGRGGSACDTTCTPAS